MAGTAKQGKMNWCSGVESKRASEKETSYSTWSVVRRIHAYRTVPHVRDAALLIVKAHVGREEQGSRTGRGEGGVGRGGEGCFKGGNRPSRLGKPIREYSHRDNKDRMYGPGIFSGIINSYQSKEPVIFHDISLASYSIRI